MNKVVSFSGGRTSAYLVILMIQTFGAENVNVVCMDTGAEHPKTYEFIRKFALYLEITYGVKIAFLRGVFDQPLGVGVEYNVVSDFEIGCDLKPFSNMMKKYGTPYTGGMFCTDRMKLQPFKKYCNDKYCKQGYETWLGIRADEPKRLGEKKGIRYLAEISEFEKQDVLNFWKEMPFDLGIEEHLGNCVFCPKKSNLKLAAAQRDEPELYIKWLDSIHSDSVRKVDSRTKAYMIECGVKKYNPLTSHRRSDGFLNKLNNYNENLFSSKNPKWGDYEKIASSKMYRGNQSLEQLIATFDGSTGAEIKARMRGAKHLDTGSCSESCEVFSD